MIYRESGAAKARPELDVRLKSVSQLACGLALTSDDLSTKDRAHLKAHTIR